MPIVNFKVLIAFTVMDFRVLTGPPARLYSGLCFQLQTERIDRHANTIISNNHRNWRECEHGR